MRNYLTLLNYFIFNLNQKNTPILIANLFEAVKYINQIKDGTASITEYDLKTLTTIINTFVFDILGLVNVSINDTSSDKLSGAVELLINLRQEARANKDFKLSDKIRNELSLLRFYHY